MATRKDIAEKAGVSISVVSRALNNSGYVDAGKKARIIEVANELGYTPNPVAVSLSTKRTKQILFYCRELENPFNIEMYEGMVEVAHERGYMVLINGWMSFDGIANAMVDGVILPNEEITRIYLEQIGKNYRLPLVCAGYTDAVSFSRSVPVILCDMWDGMEKIITYLKKRGHRKIAMISPYPYTAVASARTLAYKEAMRDILGKDRRKYYFGICKEELADSRLDRFREEIYKGNISVPEDFFGKGYLAADIFVESGSDATAVVCFNDEMAYGFIRGLQSRGKSVPKDVSVVGCDYTFARRYAEKPLTTLNIHPRQQGEKCVNILLDMIEGKKYKHVSHIPLAIEEGETVSDRK